MGLEDEREMFKLKLKLNPPCQMVLQEEIRNGNTQYDKRKVVHLFPGGSWEVGGMPYKCYNCENRKNLIEERTNVLSKRADK